MSWRTVRFEVDGKEFEDCTRLLAEQVRENGFWPTIPATCGCCDCQVVQVLPEQIIEIREDEA